MPNLVIRLVRTINFVRNQNDGDGFRFKVCLCPQSRRTFSAAWLCCCSSDDGSCLGRGLPKEPELERKTYFQMVWILGNVKNNNCIKDQKQQ